MSKNNAWGVYSDLTLAPLIGELLVEGSNEHFMLTYEHGLQEHHFAPGLAQQAYNALVNARIKNIAPHIATLSGGDSALMTYLTQLKTVYQSRQSTSLGGDVFVENLKLCKQHSRRHNDRRALEQAIIKLDAGGELQEVRRWVADRVLVEDAQPMRGERAADLAQAMRSRLKTRLPAPIRSKIATLDTWMPGMQPGQLLILLAAKKQRKTSVALTMALNLARDGHGVPIFMYESTRDVVAWQLVCMLSIEWLIANGLYNKPSSRPGVMLNHISPTIMMNAGDRYKNMGDERVEAIEHGLAEFERLEHLIRIYDQRPDSGNLAVNTFQQLLALDMHKYPPAPGKSKFLIIDHLQRMTGDGSEYEQQLHTVRAIEREARTTDTFTILLAQQAGHGGVRGGTMAAEAADYVIKTAYRKDMGNMTTDDYTLILEMADSRYGPSGQDAAIWIDPFTGYVVDNVNSQIHS